jgi:hypothetical protein
MNPLGNDLKLVVTFFDSEIRGREKRAIDSEYRGAVFEYKVWGIFITD